MHVVPISVGAGEVASIIAVAVIASTASTQASIPERWLQGDVRFFLDAAVTGSTAAVTGSASSAAFAVTGSAALTITGSGAAASLLVSARCLLLF